MLNGAVENCRMVNRQGQNTLPLRFRYKLVYVLSWALDLTVQLLAQSELRFMSYRPGHLVGRLSARKSQFTAALGIDLTNNDGPSIQGGVVCV